MMRKILFILPVLFMCGFAHAASYRAALDENTTGGAEFIYRVNPGNTNAFGNESILMFKMNHRIGL